MYESDDEQSRRLFHNHESNNKPLINLNRLVIMGKYQTLVFYVLSRARCEIFS